MGINLLIAVTDGDWFEMLRRQPDLNEVNFWAPPAANFRVEPILKAVGFVTFVDYGKFVEASKADPKIDVLSETNNMYRTLCAIFLLLLLVVLFDLFAPSLPWLVEGSPYIVGVALVVMFLFAYQKQTAYIVGRVNKVVDGKQAGTDGDDVK